MTSGTTPGAFFVELSDTYRRRRPMGRLHILDLPSMLTDVPLNRSAAKPSRKVSQSSGFAVGLKVMLTLTLQRDTDQHSEDNGISKNRRSVPFYY